MASSLKLYHGGLHYIQKESTIHRTTSSTSVVIPELMLLSWVLGQFRCLQCPFVICEPVTPDLLCCGKQGHMWLSSIHPRTKQHFLKSLNAQFGHSVFIDALVNLALCHFGQLHVGAVIWSAGHYSPTQQTRCPVEAHESESSLVKKNMELTTENNTFEIGQDTFFLSK